ncbi:MAG: winged helix-turn-helix transcriptional regulator [Desulfovibrio sp.]|nr:winged helix-turn-helix transcriptional regulator [Desulfovibrio sp.]
MSQSLPSCDSDVIHHEAVEDVRRILQKDTLSQDLATFFKLFSDPTRIKLLRALLVRELCVCDLAAVLGVTKSAVSHHLKALKLLNIVRYRREGQVVFYALADSHVESILSLGLEHITE